MNHPNPPPPPPFTLPATTHHLLKQTTKIFRTHLLTFLFLSTLLFTFHSNLLSTSLHLTSFIDNNPSLHSLLSHLPPLSTPSPPHPHPHPHPHPRRRRSFLHLTRLGTLDDDFFSGEDHPSSIPNPPFSNSTPIYLNPNKLGFSHHIYDNGIRISEVIRPGVSFKFPQTQNQSRVITKELAQDNQIENQNQNQHENEKIVSFQFFIRGFELGPRDTATLLFLVGILSLAFGYAMLGFIVTYDLVFGIVFVTVVNDLLENYVSFFRKVWDGSSLGVKRVSGFILMRWAVRDAVTQLLGIWFFGEIEDQYLFFKIFVRLKLMPFSCTSLWVKGYDRESITFLLSWWVLDAVVGLVFAVDAWVVIVDSRKSGREVLKEGCHLLSTILSPAISIKCLEGLICGSFARWLLMRFFGKLFASAFQSVMEVYFMVAWLLYYFAARYKDATLHARPFGRRELEGFLEVVR